MLILVQRGRQGEVELLVLRVDGLRRQQRHLAVFQQLENPFDLEGGRPTGKFVFLAALLDSNPLDARVLDERLDLGGEGFDVSRLVILVQGNFLDGDGHMREGAALQGGDGEDSFAAFDFDAAEGHWSPWSVGGGAMLPLVGASLLAMVVNDNAGSLIPRGVWPSIASKLAPTVGQRRLAGGAQ